MARRLTIPELSPISDINEHGAMLVRQDGRDRWISYGNMIVDISDTLKSDFNDSWNAQALDGTPIDVEMPQDGEVAIYRQDKNGFVNQRVKANDIDWGEFDVNEFQFLRLNADGRVIKDFVSVNSMVAGNSNTANMFLRVDAQSQNVNAVPFNPDEFTINAQFLEGQNLNALDMRYLRANLNLSDVHDKSQARTAIDVFSKSESDNKYATKAANLNDLVSKAQAFDNIKQRATQAFEGVVELATGVETRDGVREDLAVTPKSIKENYYTKQESNNQYLQINQNLADIGNRVAARTNLDVYSKAEGDQRYLVTGLNLSDVTNKTLARNNLEVYSRNEMDVILSGINSVPIGCIMAFPSGTAPEGWFKCNGALVNKSTYSNLFTVLGGIYGETSTQFRVPDLRGEFIRGWDDGRGVDSGRSLGSQQGEAFRSHTHTGSTSSAGYHSHSGTTNTTGAHTHTSSGVAFVPQVNLNRVGSGSRYLEAQTVSSSSAGNHAHSLSINSNGAHTHAITMSNTGGPETRPRNVAMMYCIKY